jgi:hypothetical protein
MSQFNPACTMTTNCILLLSSLVRLGHIDTLSPNTFPISLCASRHSLACYLTNSSDIHRFIRFTTNNAILCIDIKKNNSIFRDVTPRGSFKNRRSNETSVLIRATWRNIPEDGILQTHGCGNLKS